jgi:hypothetical protein
MQNSDTELTSKHVFMSPETTPNPNPRRVAAGRRNRAKRKGLTPEGRVRLRESAHVNQPWQFATGPRTQDGKARGSEWKDSAERAGLGSSAPRRSGRADGVGGRNGKRQRDDWRVTGSLAGSCATRLWSSQRTTNSERSNRTTATGLPKNRSRGEALHLDELRDPYATEP